MIPAERFSYRFNQILSDGEYPYISIYDQNMDGNIRFMFKRFDGDAYELESIYDPTIYGFRYSISVDDINKFFDHFNSRLKIGKEYIKYGYLSRIVDPNQNLEISQIVSDSKNSIDFDISGSLYRIFITLLLINESSFVSKNIPKFAINDRVITNFGNGCVFDYIYDVKNDNIEYVCLIDPDPYMPLSKMSTPTIPSTNVFRSIGFDRLRIDRDHKIEKILNK